MIKESIAKAFDWIANRCRSHETIGLMRTPEGEEVNEDLIDAPPPEGLVDRSAVEHMIYRPSPKPEVELAKPKPLVGSVAERIARSRGGW